MSALPLVTVHAQTAVGDGLYELTFDAPADLARTPAEPGQFVHIRVSDSFDYLLRRPLSVCRADPARNRLTVVYRAAGPGTRRLARAGAGDRLDVLGPLGRGFPLHAGDARALLIGGGIGVPPLVELARRLRAAGVAVTAAVGYQTAAQAVLWRELRACGELFIATDDGTLGAPGLVTGLLTKGLCATADRYYACGPTPMLRAVQARMRAFAVPGYLSLEERMGCGIGLCAGCVHPVLRDGSVKNVKTCREGPVFPADEVVFT